MLGGVVSSSPSGPRNQNGAQVGSATENYYSRGAARQWRGGAGGGASHSRRSWGLAGGGGAAVQLLKSPCDSEWGPLSTEPLHS